MTITNERTKRARPAPGLSPDHPRYIDEDHAGAFGRIFRAALLQALDEIGSTSPATLALAHSRAAVRTWDLTRLHALDASTVRLRVLAEESASLRVPPLRAGLEVVVEPEPDVVEEPDDVEDLKDDVRVPRPDRTRSDRVRRSGSRH